MALCYIYCIIFSLKMALKTRNMLLQNYLILWLIKVVLDSYYYYSTYGLLFSPSLPLRTFRSAYENVILAAPPRRVRLALSAPPSDIRLFQILDPNDAIHILWSIAQLSAMNTDVIWTWRRVVWYNFTSVSEYHSASIIRIVQPPFLKVITNWSLRSSGGVARRRLAVIYRRFGSDMLSWNVVINYTRKLHNVPVGQSPQLQYAGSRKSRIAEVRLWMWDGTGGCSLLTYLLTYLLHGAESFNKGVEKTT